MFFGHEIMWVNEDIPRVLEVGNRRMLNFPISFDPNLSLLALFDILIVQNQFFHVQVNISVPLVDMLVIQGLCQIVCGHELEAWPPESELPINLHQHHQVAPFIA